MSDLLTSDERPSRVGVKDESVGRVETGGGGEGGVSDRQPHFSTYVSSTLRLSPLTMTSVPSGLSPYLYLGSRGTDCTSLPEDIVEEILP